ncbi:MAG: hypothetical protein ABI947_17255 [Chloroflexota bacterium]
MIWLLRRVLILELILAGVCGAVVLIAQQNHTPDLLQRLDFGVCDGEPCWRGIKPGMAWDKVQNYDLMLDGKSRQYAVHLPPISGIRFDPDEREAKISGITIEFDSGPALPLTLGEVITRYGSPCRVVMNLNLISASSKTTFYWIDLLYPTMQLSFSSEDGAGSGFRLRPESQIVFFQLITEDNPNRVGTCGDLSENEGSWYGFTSVEKYLARFAQTQANVPRQVK